MTTGKNGIIMATSAVALMLATPVLAGGDIGKPETQRGAQTQPDSMTQPGKRVQASELIGKELHTPSGKQIGNVESVIIDGAGDVASVIVNVGDFLGIGGREVALDWKDLRLSRDGDAIRTSLTEAQLKALPAYKYAKSENRGKVFSITGSNRPGEDTYRNQVDD